MNLDSCFHRKPWIPAFAGMTKMGQKGLFTKPSSLGFGNLDFGFNIFNFSVFSVAKMR